MDKIISSKIETWINQETGEVRQVQEIDVRATDKGFDKVWLGMILSVLELFGSKKIDVVKYILENRSRTENTITVSQRKIAQEMKISYQTVNDTMRILKESSFITQIVPGHYRINPAVIWRGNHWSRMAIMAKFSAEMASTGTQEENPGQAMLPGVMMPQTGTEG